MNGANGQQAKCRALANPFAMRNVYSVIKYQQQMRNQNKQKGEQQKKQSEQTRDRSRFDWALENYRMNVEVVLRPLARALQT